MSRWDIYPMRDQAPAAGRGCPHRCAGFVIGKETDDGKNDLVLPFVLATWSEEERTVRT